MNKPIYKCELCPNIKILSNKAYEIHLESKKHKLRKASRQYNLNCSICNKKMEYVHDWFKHFQSKSHKDKLIKYRQSVKPSRKIYTDKEVRFLEYKEEFPFGDY